MDATAIGGALGSPRGRLRDCRRAAGFGLAGRAPRSPFGNARHRAQEAVRFETLTWQILTQSNSVHVPPP